MKISPSIASANLLNIKEELKKAEAYGKLHLDIEDGNFSPYITFGMDLIAQIAEATELELDAHLMVTNPFDYIVPLAKNKVTNIAFHLESMSYPFQCIEKARSLGVKAGIALNYKTRAEEVTPYLDKIDYVLLQSGEAGDPALAFQPYTYEKIKQIRKITDKLPIWVDGGIRWDMLGSLELAGVSCAVMGRSVFNREGDLLCPDIQ